MNKIQYQSRRTGKYVQVLNECTILPEKEEAVCYREVDGDKTVYVLTKDMFEATFSPCGAKEIVVNPSVVSDPMDEIGVSENREVQDVVETMTSMEKLLHFLDANTYREKIQILEDMKEELDDHLLNNMAVSLDLSIEDGMDGYALIMSELRIRSRFEGKRGERL